MKALELLRDAAHVACGQLDTAGRLVVGVTASGTLTLAYDCGSGDWRYVRLTDGLMPPEVTAVLLEAPTDALLVLGMRYGRRYLELAQSAVGDRSGVVLSGSAGVQFGSVTGMDDLFDFYTYVNMKGERDAA